MGWQLTQRVWDSALPGGLKAMAAAIASMVFDRDHGDVKALTLFASMGRIARCRGTHLTAARKQVHGLVALGVLEVVAPGGGRRTFGAGRRRRVGGVSTLYRFHPEKLPSYPGENARESASYPGENARESASYPSENARAITRNVRLTGSTYLAGACTASTPAAPTAIRTCFAAFKNAYAERFQQEPLFVKGKDGKLFQQLLAHYGEAEVLRLVDRMFTSRDARTERSDFTVGAFHSLAPHLSILDQKLDTRTAENLTAARRAMRQMEKEPQP